MTKVKFLRRNTLEYSKLGLRRKKLRKWRRPKGRDNKMRLKERGRPRVVSVGYKQNIKTRLKIDGKNINFVQNLDDIKKLSMGSIVLLGRMGMKKKILLMEEAKEKKIKIINIHIKKLENKLKKLEKEISDKKAKKYDSNVSKKESQNNIGMKINKKTKEK